MRNTIHHGDALEFLRMLPDNSIHCTVTSPPYWGLRDYGTGKWVGGDPECHHKGDKDFYTMNAAAPSSKDVRIEGGPENAERLKKGRWRQGGTCERCGAVRDDPQYGLERTPADYIDKQAAVFRETWRVTRPDGVLFLNMGDSYASGKGSCFNPGGGSDSLGQHRKAAGIHRLDRSNVSELKAANLKPKDLAGMPWRLALALQAGWSACKGCGLELRSDLWPVWDGRRVCIDCLEAGRRDSKIIETQPGWYLRADVIWHKPNPMPESAGDRPTKSHEYVFVMSKGPRYFWDAEAIAEETAPATGGRQRAAMAGDGRYVGLDFRDYHDGRTGRLQEYQPGTRNVRTVWTIGTEPFGFEMCRKCKRVYSKKEHHALPTVPVNGDDGRRAAVCVVCGHSDQWLSHFATFPEELAARCIMAGSPITACGTCGAPFATTKGFWPTCGHDDPTGRAIVLDPYMGAGTVAKVAREHGRDWCGSEINGDYIGLIAKRLEQLTLGF